MAPDTAKNSYLLEVDGGACYTVGDSALQAGKWTWVDYQNAASTSKVTLNLSAGQHTVKLLGREASVKVDRILAATDTNCVPVDAGNNCAVASDSTVPTVSVVIPAEGTSVTGTVSVAAKAADDKGVVKVEFYVNNVLQATSVAAPYNFSWKTAGLANGTYVIAAKAYDAAGNAATDTSTVTIKNGDIQAPTAPANVKAAAASATKIALTWGVSTDNTAVTGYTVQRNGVTLTTVSAPGYTDNTALPGTAYTYKVAAYDAAGNTSGFTSAATVTTPSAADNQAPTTPINVVATAAGTTQVNLSWKASADNFGVSGYDIYRAPLGGTSAKVATVAGIQFGDSNLKAGTTYAYSIVAKDAAGNASAQSAIVNVTTEAATPPAQQATGVIRGKALGANKKPLTGVAVTAHSSGKTYLATSNASGVYRFDGLPSGQYDLHWEVKGYEDADERLRVRSGVDTVWNMDLVPINGRSHWWNRWWR